MVVCDIEVGSLILLCKSCRLSGGGKNLADDTNGYRRIGMGPMWLEDIFAPHSDIIIQKICMKFKNVSIYESFGVGKDT